MTNEKLYNLYKNAYTRFIKAKKGSSDEAQALFEIALANLCAKTNWK